MDILTALLFSDAADSFTRLFTEMNGWTIVLFVLGIIFCAIEACVPGFGFFGIAGSIMIAAGIVVRMIFGGDLYMLLYMVLIALVLFCLMFFVASYTQRTARQNGYIQRGYGRTRGQDRRHPRFFVTCW